MKKIKDHVLYYYLRDRDKRPMVTVCLIIDPKNLPSVHRGIAIGSYSEPQIIKSVGRDLAYRRARKAMLSKRTSLFINPLNNNQLGGVYFKSRYCANLTIFEQKLVDNHITVYLQRRTGE